METKDLCVLLIEDNPADAGLIRLALSEAPGGIYRMEHVESLSRGLERLARGGVDVVLLDLTLPDSMGLPTLDKLRDMAVGVPIVVMTGLDDEAVAGSALERGAGGYLIKGRFSPDTLTRVLRDAIERSARG